jgi:hypothetical protein
MPMSYPDGWQRTAARARIRTFMLTSLPAFTQSVGDHPVLFLGCIDHKWGSSYLGKLSREHTSQGDFHDPSWDIPPRTVSARVGRPPSPSPAPWPRSPSHTRGVPSIRRGWNPPKAKVWEFDGDRCWSIPLSW